MKKRVISAALVAALSVGFVGCGNSVDQKRLVELTGDKNFEQVKQAWQSAIMQEKPEDAKIYDYWLHENGKVAEATFNTDGFEQSFMIKYNKELKKSKQKMAKIKEGVDKAIKEAKQHHWGEVDYQVARQLRQMEQMAVFAVPSSGFVRNTYYPFLQKQLKRIDEANKELKKLRDEKIKKDMQQ